MVHSVEGSEIDVDVNGREPGIQHCTIQVGPSDYATSYIFDTSTCRMTGMKDISFPKAQRVFPTYGMDDKTDLLIIRSKLTFHTRSINRDPTTYVRWMAIVFFDVTLGFLQGEDADDFNPDRFLGNLPSELAADTKDGASFFFYRTRLLRDFWFARYRR